MENLKKNEKENAIIKSTIKINETGTINPKFQSNETKEKYGVDFDPCKMLTPEITEKFGFDKGKLPELQNIPKNGEVSCYLQSPSGNQNFSLRITDNDNKIN